MSNSMPWFKIWNEMPYDFKWESLASTLDKSRTEIIGAWVTILALASASPERGTLLVTRYTPVTSQSLSALLRWDVTETEALIQELIHHGMLEDRDECEYIVVNWNKRQLPPDPTGAKRQAEHRERQKLQLVTRDVTRNKTESNAQEDRGQRIEDRKEERKEEVEMQILLETIVGLPARPQDLPGIDELTRLGAQDSDIRGALQWRLENNVGPVKKLNQLFSGIKTEYSKRVQTGNARKNGGPKEDLSYLSTPDLDPS